MKPKLPPCELKIASFSTPIRSRPSRDETTRLRYASGGTVTEPANAMWCVESPPRTTGVTSHRPGQPLRDLPRQALAEQRVGRQR